MSSGLVELISLLLGLAGFGIQPDPKPPTVDASLAYAIADPDFVVHADLTALVPGNYKAMLELGNQPSIQSSPELAALVRKTVGELEGERGLLRQATGIDVTTDITDATVFVQLTAHGDPNFLATVHGTFGAANVDKMAAAAHHKVTPTSAGAWVELDAKTAVGVTHGVLLAGTTPWVRDRMADAWRAPSHAPGTTLGYAAAALGDRPVAAVVATLSAVARKEVAHATDAPLAVADLLAQHKASAVAIYADGMGWSLTATTKSDLEAMAAMSDGLVDLLRAAQIAPRGLGKLGIGALEAYRSDKRVAALLAHRDELLKVVSAYTSDGAFKVKIDKDPAKLTLAVRCTGRTASEVVPVGALLPIAVIALLPTMP